MNSAADVWMSLQSRPHGSSGRGISYYAAWNGQCSRRAELNHKLADEGHEAESPTDSRGYHYFDVGSYYHMLHEIATRGQLPNEAWDISDALDVDFAEGLRLFNGWRNRFGSLEEKYGGVVLGVEFALPSTPEARNAAHRLFEGDLTARVDVAMRIDDPDTARRNTMTEHSPGLSVVPGVYLIDFKTASAYSDRDYFKYTHDLQARNYLTLYNLEHKEAPARGMIFDQIVKHSKFAAYPVHDSKGKVKQHSSFHAYLQHVSHEDIPILRAVVKHGMANALTPRPNPHACIQRFDTCPHLLSGICTGH